ncbi:hypothetical protein GCM10017556_14850 [Micromonospora sagamiensis]|uniref:Uncharacterized protein n=2 Tax=Micromonospora sagamiensis TaxID=47875 RepID=A0A562WAQ1_9ACTN|nr:hypothetical protein JD81_00852 [Micromonospora sagamiensis]BCL13746.1 hypothetical protein GCM10017556_14850 [Micromonospora sagamiensis]
MRGFATLVGMADDSVDPGGTIESYRAFVPAPELASPIGPPVPESSKPSLIGAAVVAALLLALAFWIALS